MARAGCHSPEDREQLRKAAEAELNIDNGNGAADAEEQEGKSQIQVNNRQLRDIVEDAEQAILKNNTRPIIFQRDGTLVWIRKNERGRCTIERLSEPAMRAHLTDCADFNRVNKDGHRTQVHPPRDVAQTLLAKSKFSYPGLQGVVEARSSGRMGLSWKNQGTIHKRSSSTTLFRISIARFPSASAKTLSGPQSRCFARTSWSISRFVSPPTVPTCWPYC